MKSRYKGAAVLGILLLAVFAIIAVSGIQERTDDDRKRIAYIAPLSGENMPYWKAVENGLLEGSLDLPVELVFFSQDEVDERMQLSHFEQAINMRFDGIITMALNPESFTPVINRADQEGIPVVLLDGDAPNSKRLSFFGSNNYEAGLTVARLIDDLDLPEARLGVVTAGITLRHITDRLDGIQTYFAGREDLHFQVVEDSRANEEIAFRKTESIIESGEINVIFAAGAVDSLGVAAALEALRIPQGNLIGIGFDDTPETLDYVRRGVLTACIAQSPFEMGRRSVISLHSHLSGKHTFRGIHYTPVTVVTLDNIDSYKREANDD